MLKIKKMLMPALFGFVLSFLISLIASRKFFVSLGRGVIFAVVFAGLFLLIDFIFARFLDSDSPSFKKNSSPERGKMVDITIADEELSDVGEDLKFPVSQNLVGLGAEKIDSMRKPSAPADESVKKGPAPQTESVGVQSLPPDDVPSKNESSPSKPSNVSQSAQSASAAPASNSGFTPVPLGTPLKEEAAVSKAGDLDELPDMMDFDSELGSEDDGFSADEIINDSDFAGGGNGASDRPTFSDGSKATDHDAATLAKAIQTILKREE